MPGIFKMIKDCIDLWFTSDSYASLQLKNEMLEVHEDQEYLNELIIEAEYEAERETQRLKRLEQAKAIEERKAQRLEKAAEKYERQELAREARRKKMQGDSILVQNVMIHTQVYYLSHHVHYKIPSFPSVSIAAEVSLVISASGPPNLNLFPLFFLASSVRIL